MKGSVHPKLPGASAILDTPSEGASQALSFAPNRLPSQPHTLDIASLAGSLIDKPLTLEQIEQVLLSACMQPDQRLSIQAFQEIPTQAVSLMQPPERAWLIQVALCSEENALDTGVIEEGIVILKEQKLSLTWR